MQTIKIIFKSGASTSVEMCKEAAIDLFNEFDKEQTNYRIIDLYIRLENVDCMEILKKI